MGFKKLGEARSCNFLTDTASFREFSQIVANIQERNYRCSEFKFWPKFSQNRVHQPQLFFSFLDENFWIKDFIIFNH